MQKADIKVGGEYALRESRMPGTPLQHVRIVEHIRRNKWRAEWIEPNPGLKDYVESQHLVVPWKQRKAFLRDEESEQRLREHNARLGGTDDSPVTVAVGEVLASTGEQLMVLEGALISHPDALARVKERARLDPTKRSPVAYVDRHGQFHVPFDEALELARAFCSVEPVTVLTSVEAAERQASQDASQRGGDHFFVGLLNEYRASAAIIRQWTGHDPAIAQREARIEMLERLVWDAIYALQKAGLDSEAHRLRRAIEKT